MSGFLLIPVDFESILDKTDLRRLRLRESVGQHIRLILITHFGENKFDKSYGCEVWEYDFEKITSENKWKDTIVTSIEHSLKNHESRIYDVDVNLELTDEEIIIKGAARIKKRLTINIKAKIKQTGEDFFTNPVLYLSPFSFD